MTFGHEIQFLQLRTEVKITISSSVCDIVSKRSQPTLVLCAVVAKNFKPHKKSRFGLKTFAVAYRLVFSNGSSAQQSLRLTII